MSEKPNLNSNANQNAKPNLETPKVKNKTYWITSEGLQTVSLSILAAIGMAFALSLTKSIMIPFVLSLFLYFILSPVRTFFVKKMRFPNWLALISTFAVVALVLTLIFFILFSAIQEFAGGYRAYVAKAVYFADSIQDWAVLKGIPIENYSLADSVKNLPFGQLVKGAGSTVLSLISTTLLVFIFLVFLLSGVSVHQKTEEVARSSMGKEIHDQIRKYLSVKLLTSTVTACLVFVILSFLKIDLLFVFCFMVFILNFIPTVGSLFATLLPLPVAFFQYETALPIVLVIAIPGVVQFIIGNIIEPKLMGHSLNLHPVTILMSLMFWSLIWGIVGALLAVPIMAIIKIALQKVEGGEYVARLMSGDIEDPTV
jgi:AI-2 transport protein TqsA